MVALAQQFLQTLDELQKLTPLRRVLVGVSGGPDSVCLLHLLVHLHDRFDHIAVAHLNHGLRGQESDDDQTFVQLFCQQRELPFYTETVAIKELAVRLHRGIEDTAREARYTFFANLMATHQLDAVLIAHTLDDQVETILGNFIRGSGLHGLEGMKMISELRFGDMPAPIRVVRPLLGIRKADLLQYLELHQVAFRIDSTNADTDLTRNKIRHQILPKLMEINPEVHAAIDHTSTLAREVNAHNEAQLQTLMNAETLFQKKSEIEMVLNKNEYLNFATSQKRELLNSLLRELVGEKKEITYDHIDNAMQFIESGKTGDEIHLAGGIRLHQLPHAFSLSTEDFKANPIALQTLPEDGTIRLPGGILQCHLIRDPGELSMIRGLVQTLSSPMRVFIDADLAGLPLQVRSWENGDRIMPLGMKTEKKLQDLFVDDKIPRHQRLDLPVILGHDNRIVWVTGLMMSETCRLQNMTHQILELSFTPKLN